MIIHTFTYNNFSLNLFSFFLLCIFLLINIWVWQNILQNQENNIKIPFLIFIFIITTVVLTIIIYILQINLDKLKTASSSNGLCFFKWFFLILLIIFIILLFLLFLTNFGKKFLENLFGKNLFDLLNKLFPYLAIMLLLLFLAMILPHVWNLIKSLFTNDKKSSEPKKAKDQEKEKDVNEV